MADKKVSPESVNFREVLLQSQHKRCGGYSPDRPCSMFVPYHANFMDVGDCTAVDLPEMTDNHHTCDIWEARSDALR